MATPKRPTRAYRSPLRAEKAAETRQQIITAAGEVFSERGYAGATMAQVAERAGVSVESVHGLGTKPALLILAFKQTYAGASGWRTILDEPDLLRIMSTEDNDEAIVGYAEFITAANGRSHGIWPAVRTAALSEPRVAEQIEELIALKKQDFLMGAAWYAERGIIDAAADPAVVAPYLYLLTSQETYDQLVQDWGYAPETYAIWLAEAIRAMGASTAKLPAP
jgi:AcrR family transcriptional regulator